MSVPSICTGNKFRDTAEYFRGLLPIFVFEGNVKFQLESSENEDQFSPIWVYRLPEFCSQFFWRVFEPQVKNS